MLDEAGYTVDRDLTRERVLEPSTGDGAFVGTIVERLVASRARYKADSPWTSLADCLRGFDLQADHVETITKSTIATLTGAGCPQSVAELLADTWFTAADFLLTDLGSWTATLGIGNPPYIRIEDVPADLLAAYRAACPEMIGRADVYVGFIARTLDLLAPSGRLVFICADRWMHNAYGKALRAKVLDGYNVRYVLKLHGVDAFEGEVDAYPAITLIARGAQSGAVVAEALPEFDADAAASFLKFGRTRRKALKASTFTATRTPGWHKTAELWPQGSADVQAWLADLAARHQPLEDPDGATMLRIGVASGRDTVFVVGPDNVPAIEPSRLLPLATSKDIKSGVFAWGGRYLVDPYEEDGTLITLSAYPKAERYLRKHKAALDARHIVRTGRARWYKTIDGVQHERVKRPYLALEDLKGYAHPVLIPAGYYPHHGLYAISSTSWDLRLLGGLLLSEVFERQVAAYCVRMRGETLRFQAQYIRMCRVPDPASIPDDVALELAAAFDDRDRERATAAAKRAYGIKTIPS